MLWRFPIQGQLHPLWDVMKQAKQGASTVQNRFPCFITPEFAQQAIATGDL